VLFRSPQNPKTPIIVMHIGINTNYYYYYYYYFKMSMNAGDNIGIMD